MVTALLSTKLYIPPQHQGLVARPRLIERLDAGLQGKLTLVSAPAGFGKTTLVSEWVRQCGRTVAWLSLDQNDNDMTRFLTYLIAALQRMGGDIGVDIQAALSESQAPQFETLLTKLVSEIDGIPTKSILILDDYHLIDSKAVHAALNFLIDYLPPTMHLVIVGRTDPPLPVARLRVQKEVSEIRTPELRFTEAEVAAFLNDLMGFELSPEDITTLETRTEGWIASLQLAALSMQGRDDWQEFITTFSGSHRYIIDYLVDEVMARQPAAVRAFLRRTVILERFCAPLCKTVVSGEEIGDGGIIDYLERSNLFLIPLDDHRQWYRYHHLFADFLEQRLREEEPDHISELHRRASQWYEAEDLLDEAIHHALAAGDLEGAARLVDGIAASLVVRKEFNKLLKLMEQLPLELRQNYPMLCIWHAWSSLFLGQLEAVEAVLEIAEANRGKTLGVPISGYATTVRAYLVNQMGDLLTAIDLAEQALAEMAGASPDPITLIFRGAAVIWLGVNHRHLGDLDRAKELFAEAAALNQEAGNIYGALSALEQLADLALLQGQLYQSLEIYRRGLQLAQKWSEEQGIGGGTLLATSGLHLGLGTALYQMNDLVSAAPHIQRAVELDELGEAWGRGSLTYRMLAYLKWAEGDYQTAYDLLVKACTIRDTARVRQINIATEPGLEQLRILLSRARPEMTHLLTDVGRRVEILGLRPDDEVNFSSQEGYPRESEYADLARALVALGRAAEALPLLERLLEAAQVMGRQGDEIRYLILFALAFQALADEPAALEYLRRALKLAESQGYIRIFVDEGEPLLELLEALGHQSSAVGQIYVESLLAVFDKETDNERHTLTEEDVGASCLVEPMSERELEVLRLMAMGYKYQEVAELLVISLNTVRHHTKNVYSKLNVNNRAQAIARAKELNFL